MGLEGSFPLIYFDSSQVVCITEVQFDKYLG